MFRPFKNNFRIFNTISICVTGISFLLFSCVPGSKDQIVEVEISDTIKGLDKITLLNQKIKENPDNPVLYFERAQFHFDNKDTEGSYNDINRALKLDSSKAEFYLLLADIHFIKKEGIKAREILNKCLEKDPNNTEAYLKLSEIYFLVEQYGKSIDYINQALKVDVNNSKAYFMKGMNYKYMGDTAKAISSMQTAIEQNNDYYDAYIQLGLLKSSSPDSIAVYYFENALRVNPKSVEALYGKAMYHQEHRQFERALEGYMKILEIDANNFVAFFNMGYVNLVYIKNLEGAIENFTRAIELNPNYFEAYCNRGIAYEKKKNFKNAEADFRKSLEIRPDYTPAAKGISRVVDKDFD